MSDLQKLLELAFLILSSKKIIKKMIKKAKKILPFAVLSLTLWA